ncbi:MAG: hypothetical protein ACRKFN_02635 [Desulfitobacterium sp.]
MKMKKKTAIIASFTVGTLLFATTAFADIASKSGYEQLKDSVKLVSAKATGEYDNYTMEMTAIIKDNGQVIISSNAVNKVDRIKNAQESNNTNVEAGKTSTYYNYNDRKTSINIDQRSDKVYETEYNEEREHIIPDDPFAEEEAADVERIIDAVVGSLKDHVIVNENPDGTKVLSGSLSEMQIPALVNAVSSLSLKQQFDGRNQNNSWPHLTKDITVKEVSGSANVKEDGALERILGTATVTGKDANGQNHDITIEILGSIKDVNSTVVAKPDLTGKEVIKQYANAPNEINNPQKFVGTFKNDIIIEKEGKFVKTGERILELTQIDRNSITGNYKEVYKPEFADSANQMEAFAFKATFNEKSMRDANFDISTGNNDNRRGYIYLDDYAGKVNFNVDSYDRGMNGIMFDSNFSPVLE